MAQSFSFLQFPAGFRWGSATSSHQVEGHNRNSWSAWEKANAKSLASAAAKKYPASQQQEFPELLDPKNYISAAACDHYRRYESDFDLAQSLNHNAHRFSLEWSRLEPKEGQFNSKALAHYRKVMEALQERRLQPFISLWHYTLPRWLEKKGGPAHRRFPFYFNRYTRYVAENLIKPGQTFPANLAPRWITLNEPTLFVFKTYITRQWTPNRFNPLAAINAYYHLAQAHNQAYQTLHQLHPAAQVGFSHIINFREPFNPRCPFDRLASRLATYVSDEKILNLTRDHHDFFGLNYYFHDRIKFPYRIRNNNQKTNDLGWEIYPQGLYHVLKSLKKYQLPVYITENGLADHQDQQRAQYIQDHLRSVHRAIQAGIDVRGYFYWSLLDNFEWEKGFWPRFGLIEVDYATQERKIRPSARVYAQICAQNGLNAT